MLRVLSLFLGFVCVDVVVYACFVVVVVFFSKADVVKTFVVLG